jgi:hypothetical protein
VKGKSGHMVYRFFMVRLGGQGSGSVALTLCATAHPRHTRSTNVFGTSISEATLRPNPRQGSSGISAPVVFNKVGVMGKYEKWQDSNFVNDFIDPETGKRKDKKVSLEQFRAV